MLLLLHRSIYAAIIDGRRFDERLKDNVVIARTALRFISRHKSSGNNRFSM
jgi:hypothetical protein